MNNLVIKNMKVVPCVNSNFVKTARVLFNQNGIDRAWDYIAIHDCVASLLFNKTRNEFILVKQFRPGLVVAFFCNWPWLGLKLYHLALILANTTTIICLSYWCVGLFTPELFPLATVYMHKNRALNKVKYDKATVKQDDSSIPLEAPMRDGVTYELCAGIVDKNIALSLIMKQEVLEECGYDVPEENFEKIFSSHSSVGTAGSMHLLFYAEVTDSMIVSEGGGNKSEGEDIEIYYLPEAKVKEFLFDESIPKPASLMAAFFWYLSTKSQQK